MEKLLADLGETSKWAIYGLLAATLLVGGLAGFIAGLCWGATP